MYVDTKPPVLNSLLMNKRKHFDNYPSSPNVHEKFFKYLANFLKCMQVQNRLELFTERIFGRNDLFKM